MLSKKQKKELQKLTDEIMGDAKSVVKDYKSNPSEISGSTIHINQSSPFLDEQFKGKTWKNVIVGSIEDAIGTISKKSLGKKKKK